MDPQHGPQPPKDIDYIDVANGVEAIAARLELMGVNDRVVLTEAGVDLAHILLIAATPRSPAYFNIRPANCTHDMIRKENDRFVSEPDESTVLLLSEMKIGGYFVPGTRIAIGSLELKLPELAPESATILDPLPERQGSSGDTTIISITSDDPSIEFDTDVVLQNRVMANAQIATLLAQGTRAENQDRVGFIEQNGALKAIYVLDGNGLQGNIAAKIVEQNIKEDILAGSAPGTILNQAGVKFKERFDAHYSSINHLPMGTCAAVFEIHAGNGYASHIGDTGIHVYRENADGDLINVFMTKDHSLAQEMIDSGETDPAQIRRYQHIITRNITYPSALNSTDPPDVSGPIPLEPGDYILLFSDGIRTLALSRVLAICKREQTPERIIAACHLEFDDETIEALAEGAAADNLSLAVARYWPETR